MTPEEAWDQYSSAYGVDSVEAFQRFFGLMATELRGPDLNRRHCCYIADDGTECLEIAVSDVRGDTWDDYTHACAGHTLELTRPGDKVYPLSRRTD